MTGIVAAKLQALGIVLPATPAPAGNYIPTVISGNLVFVSGQVPFLDGKIAYQGKLGESVSLADGQAAARLCFVNILAQLSAALGGDLDRVNAMKARLFLDGPLAPEGRVKGQARRLFLDMHADILRSPPAGPTLDAAPAFDRLGDISVPSLVICGDLEFPHIQERCRHMASTMPESSYHPLTGTAHLPSLDRPAEITGLLEKFLDRC